MATAIALLGFNERSWTFGDPYFSFQKQILLTIIYTLFKNEQKIQCGKVKKTSRSLSRETSNPAIMRLQGA